MIHRLLFEGNINIQRRTYIWNMISSVLYSIQSAVFLLFLTRAAGSTEAGSFILLFSVAQTLNAVGNYNLHEFQASDVREEYSFPTYLTTRILTCGVMLILAIGYCFWKKLSTDASAVMICLIGSRLVECMEDVFHGDIQRAGRLDVSCICSSAKLFLAAVAFCAAFVICRSQLAASVAMLAASALVSLITLHVIRSEFRERLPIRLSGKDIIKLLVSAFPIFIGAFLYTYLINAPKYAIADLMDADTQTIYNILFMPAFVINMLSLFIFRPLIVQMSVSWNSGEYRQFRKGIIRQSLMVLGLTALVILAGELIGRKMLGWIYGVDLSQYRMIFSMMLLFGGISALVFFVNLILTIMRAQIFTIAEYAFSLVVSLLLTRPLVAQYGINGAVWAYGCICGAQVLFGYGVVILKLLKSKSGQKTA